MKLGNKEIKSGLDLARNGKMPPSTTSKIEEKVRAMLIEKFGYILSNFEVEKIFNRETERRDRREESLARSQWNIMRSKERAKLREKLKRDAVEGKIFQKYEKGESLDSKKMEGIDPENLAIGKTEGRQESEDMTGKAYLHGSGSLPPHAGEHSLGYKTNGVNLKSKFIQY